MISLLGFTPDLEDPTPGVITACDQFIPYETGMTAAPTNTTPTDVPALADDCQGAAVVTLLTGTRRVFAGTATKLYELEAGAWTDQTRTVGGNYSGGADTRWSFCQFGNATLASNKTDTMQRSVSTGAFADIAGGSPKAEIIFSVSNFVMALNVNDGADKQDGWHCCAAFDETDWTESVTTQSASGRLVSTPGILTAGLRLGEYAVAYKTNSIYLGQYVGPPAVWDWLLVPGGGAGCVGKEALCDIDGAHFFVGDDNIWIFDGSRPVPIASNTVRQWFFDNSSAANRFKTKCVFDRQNNRVWVFFPSTSSDSCDRALVYHLLTKQWGLADRDIQAALQYVSSGATFDTWDDFGATFDTLPDISFDSQYWLAGGSALSVFNTSNQLQTVTGAATSSTFTTGDAGDDDGRSLLTQVRLRYSAGMKPTTASATFFYKDNSGDAYTTGDTVSEQEGKFDTFQDARWHKAQFNFTGDVDVTHIRPILKPSGER
jgi:hypothetical protein